MLGSECIRMSNYPANRIEYGHIWMTGAIGKWSVDFNLATTNLSSTRGNRERDKTFVLSHYSLLWVKSFAFFWQFIFCSEIPCRGACLLNSRKKQNHIPIQLSVKILFYSEVRAEWIIPIGAISGRSLNKLLCIHWCRQSKLTKRKPGIHLCANCLFHASHSQITAASNSQWYMLSVLFVFGCTACCLWIIALRMCSWSYTTSIRMMQMRGD